MSKKHPKKRVQSIPQLPPDVLDRLNALVEDPPSITPHTLKDILQSPQMAVAFLESVSSESRLIPTLVLSIQDTFPEKEVQKSVRKAVFRLKQRGMEISLKENAGSGGFLGFQPEPPPDPDAYLSPPDGFGHRAVFISIPRVPSGVDLAMGIISDESGVLEFVFGRYSKKKAAEMKEVFFQNVTDLTKTSLAHSASILESAYEMGKSGPNPTASGYLELRPWLLANVSLPEKPPVYDLVPLESISDVALTDSQVDRLLSHRWLQTWITGPNEIKPLIEEIMKVEQSPILMSQEQRTARVRGLKDSFLSRIYTEGRRKLIRIRLEETAYLLQKSGEGDLARIALKSAISMKEQDSEFRTNDLLKHMLEHSLALYLRSMETGEREQSEGKPQPSIILP